MRSLNLAAVVLVLVLIGGCSTSPSAAFYTLSAVPPVVAAPTTPPPMSIVIDAVTVPDLVDRPQFVLRTGATQVKIDEYARWADSLRSQISRVLAADLAQAVPGALVAGYAQHPDNAQAYRVRVDVQSFESAPGKMAAIVVLWSVWPPKGATITGRTIAREAVRTADYDALVDAHSRAFATVSSDIAGAIRSTLLP
ncbi:lipoprotein [Caballeronia terrestris]|uniref:Lipoprotein n=1 Tax=Caballeronia terrestris TaxID=1226301 RepID=A0A158KUH0_9BURK|nr:PqiC family protein [Caballeronia terrestris]SAL84379.1 lipoprotein [Caballeronia terrestris]